LILQRVSQSTGSSPPFRYQIEDLAVREYDVLGIKLKPFEQFDVSPEQMRFPDLRRQAITQMAENGAADATVMALAGQLSREMMEHYSPVRMAAKRKAVDALSGGLMRKTDENQTRFEMID
jgi:hypothetical protein